jgi:etoposide-induced 2.4 mRNA
MCLSRAFVFSRAAADFVMAILLETVFLAQSLLVVYVPIPLISQLLSYIHLSMLYALYSFEYLWMSRGCELSKRLNRIETRWPFYAGFGCVLTLATSVFAENFVLSGCIFGCLFPFFIISSYMVCIALLSALRNLGVRILVQNANFMC